MKHKITIIVFISLIVIALTFLIYLAITSITANSILSEEKCRQGGDDCWHSLAHQTLNKTYCYNINNNETKEHCLENLPEINKDNKQKW